MYYYRDRFFHLSTIPQTLLSAPLREIITAIPPICYRLTENVSPMNQEAADVLLDIDIDTSTSTAATAPIEKYPHGMYYARKVMSQIPSLCIGRYCNEGNSNTVDGNMLAGVLMRLLTK